MFQKSINVRNLTEAQYAELQAIANEHERSLEGEVRFMLQLWLQNYRKQKEPPVTEQSSRLITISKRLNFVFDKLNEIKTTRLNYSHVAEYLGLEYVQDVQDWFDGQTEPSIPQLRQLAYLFGCEPNWLIHGQGDCYCFRSFNMNVIGPIELAKALLATTFDGESLSKLHFIRLDDSSGSVYIVQEFPENRYFVYHTSTFNLSDRVGSSGATNLAKFALALQVLFYLSGDVTVKSYFLSKEEAIVIFQEKKRHPLFFTLVAKEQLWHEDILDTEPPEYWDGFKELTARIRYNIKHTPTLLDYQKQIKALKHGL